jgi:biotin-(acetyl-CoA carboxylase) ligase
MFTLQQNWRIGQNKFCLEAKQVAGRGRRGRVEGRNGPNNV